MGPTELLILGILTVGAILFVGWLMRRAATKDPVRHQEVRHGESGTPLSPDPLPAPRLPKPAPPKPSSGTSPSRIFLSYRREDSADVTGRIYDKLIAHLGKPQVFKDVDSVPFGIDFRKHLDQVIANCEIMLVVIGDRWLTTGDSKGQRRLDQPTDLVRIEIESALHRDIPVVPVLVRGASMPREEDLPDTMKAFAYRNGIAVRSDPDFHTDMDRLLSGLGLRSKAS